jgi:hypothetical protein
MTSSRSAASRPAAATAVRFEGNHLHLDSPGVPTLKFHLREPQGG